MSRKIDSSVFGDGDLLIRIGKIRQSELAAIGERLSNITFHLVIAIGTDGSGSGSVFIVSFIIRRLCIGRLRGALGLRVVGRQSRGSGVFARAILGIIANLLFGTPVSGAVYTSRLT